MGEWLDSVPNCFAPGTYSITGLWVPKPVYTFGEEKNVSCPCQELNLDSWDVQPVAYWLYGLSAPDCQRYCEYLKVCLMVTILFCFWYYMPTCASYVATSFALSFQYVACFSWGLVWCLYIPWFPYFCNISMHSAMKYPTGLNRSAAQKILQKYIQKTVK